MIYKYVFFVNVKREFTVTSSSWSVFRFFQYIRYMITIRVFFLLSKKQKERCKLKEWREMGEWIRTLHSFVLVSIRSFLNEISAEENGKKKRRRHEKDL